MSDGLDWLDKFAPPPPPTPNPNGEDWEYAFAPHTAPPSDPQTVSVSIPLSTKGTAVPEQLEAIILGYNNALSNFADGATSWPPPTASAQVLGEGVKINKIDAATAAGISTRIKPSVLKFQEVLPGVDALSVALSCLAIESTLDPACQNANTGVSSTGVPRSNPTNDPLGYDMGIAQLKLRYLVGVAPGCTDADSARAFALDIDKAIPYFVSIMAGHLTWAQAVIEKNTSSVPDPRLNDPWLLATGAYNFGPTGMLVYYENGTFPSHCQKVIDLEAYFAAKRGVASIFADLKAP